MGTNTNITFEQMPQALAEVLSQVRLIKEAVMNGDNPKHVGRGSHVLVDINRACEITGKSKHTLYRYTSQRKDRKNKGGRIYQRFNDEERKSAAASTNSSSAESSSRTRPATHTTSQWTASP